MTVSFGSQAPDLGHSVLFCITPLKTTVGCECAHTSVELITVYAPYSLKSGIVQHVNIGHPHGLIQPPVVVPQLVVSITRHTLSTPCSVSWVSVCAVHQYCTLQVNCVLFLHKLFRISRQLLIHLFVLSLSQVDTGVCLQEQLCLSIRGEAVLRCVMN